MSEMSLHLIASAGREIFVAFQFPLVCPYNSHGCCQTPKREGWVLNSQSAELRTRYLREEACPHMIHKSWK